MVIPIIEELRESLRSTRVHYTTIDAPRGVKILEVIAVIDNVKNSDSSTDVKKTTQSKISMISWSRPPPLLL